MGFDMNKLNTDQKLNINLSEKAKRVINEDAFLFGTKFTTLINRVFRNYRDDAEASVYCYLKKEVYRIFKKLNSQSPTDNWINKKIYDIINGKYDKNDPIQIVLKLKYDEIDEKIKRYPKHVSKLIRIDNENFEYLQSFELCREQLYYKNRIGKYFKAIIEEYSRMDYSSREAIYYKDIVEILNSAIRDEKKVLIRTKDDKSYTVSPYSISPNKELTYNYLIAIKDDGRSCSFRISQIKDVKRINGSFSDIKNPAIVEQINSDIEKKEVQFLTGDLDDIIVKLTERGIKMYKRIHHLRPEYTDIINGDVYKFNCTALQAEYYFFNFGEDATILEPKTLSERMKERYYNAYKNQQTNNLYLNQNY